MGGNTCYNLDKCVFKETRAWRWFLACSDISHKDFNLQNPFNWVTFLSTLKLHSKWNQSLTQYRDLRREFLSRAAQYFSMKEHSVTFLRLQWNIFGTRVRQLSTGKASEIWEANLLVFALFESFQLKEVLPFSLSSF